MKKTHREGSFLDSLKTMKEKQQDTDRSPDEKVKTKEAFLQEFRKVAAGPQTLVQVGPQKARAAQGLDPLTGAARAGGEVAEEGMKQKLRALGGKVLKSRAARGAALLAVPAAAGTAIGMGSN
jgi:hypothetical protein